MGDDKKKNKRFREKTIRRQKKLKRKAKELKTENDRKIG